MRPQVLRQYRPSFLHRIILFGMRTLFGPTVIDVARSAYYRPELMQRNYYRLQQEVLRGPSEWTVGERELFASFVSTKNRCEFCVAAHSGFASVAKSPEWVQSVLEEKLLSEANPKLGAALKFLEKLTQQPWNITPEDINILRRGGLSDEAIEEAVMVCVVFSIGNRLADSFGIEVASPAAVKRVAPFILGMGYRLYSM